MLHYKSVAAEALELLKNIQSVPLFSKMRLVGGTALALQMGHRKSVDLDFFGTLEADDHEIENSLKSLGSVNPVKRTKNIKIFIVNNIKVDFVNYPYAWLDPAVIHGKITMAGKNDICTMKLSAITGRGTRKDFIDLFFLLKEYTLDKMLELYKEKYHDGSEALVIKSLTYFTDAEENEPPTMLKDAPWEEIKNEISHQVSQYLKTKA